MSETMPPYVDYDRVDWELVAYHEAGHCVVGVTLGLQIARLTAAHSPSGTPGCEWRPLGDAPEAVRAECVTLVAGFLAEQLGTGRQDFQQGSAADNDQVLIRYGELRWRGATNSSPDEFWQEIQNQAVVLLRKNWSAVEAVADVIRQYKQHTEVDGAQVERVIKDAQPGPGS